MSDNDMPDVNEDEVVPGGGPKEGEDASKQAPNPNPDAVHPDYLQTLAGEPKPATDVPTGTSKEEGSDES
jgi:hypothetical protein